MGGSLGGTSSIISHGRIVLPPMNTTAIFRIKELKEEDEYRNELLNLTPFKLYYGVSDVQVLFPERPHRLQEHHIEKEIYQQLEKETGRKRMVIMPRLSYDVVRPSNEGGPTLSASASRRNGSKKPICIPNPPRPVVTLL